jgi:hypothetical protein
MGKEPMKGQYEKFSEHTAMAEETCEMHSTWNSWQ